MHLDRRQESDLSGERGEPRRWAMEVLCRVGDEAGSSRMVAVASAHIPSWDGPEGRSLLALARDGLGARCSLNPACASPEAAEHPPNIMDVRSCAPYLCGQNVAPGSVVAWGGRAACAFVNSAIGARSEQESTRTALAAAICGLTPERGLHLDENREATVAVVIDDSGQDLEMVGHAASALLPGERPLFCGVRPGMGAFKRLALAVNSRGGSPLFHVTDGGPPPGLERVNAADLASQGTLRKEADLLVIGCPHLSEQEINRWARRIGDDRPAMEAWFFMSRLCSDKSPKTGEVLRAAGRVIVDLCPIAMAEEMEGKRVACSSPVLADMLSDRGLDAFYLNEEGMAQALSRI